MIDFGPAFHALTGNDPFPWQTALYERFMENREDNIPASCNLPTGLGKTSVIAVWLIALAKGAAVPRRLVYVVNRRTVVDQTTDEVQKYRFLLGDAGPIWPMDLVNLAGRLSKLSSDPTRGPLALSTLRGQFADNREWSADPSRPAVICGTVDMIGSRLLFSGYGVGTKARPLHAGFLGQDALLVHDEAHLEPAFQTLIEAVRDEQQRCKDFRPLRVMELTATSRGSGEVFELTPEEKDVPPDWMEQPKSPKRYVWQRLKSKKGLKFHPAKRDAVAATIGEMARDQWKGSGKAVLVFVRTIDDVKAVCAALTDKKKGVPAEQVQVLTGTLRGLERDRLATADEVFARFSPDPKVEGREGTVYLVCTSAGEVGVDISADHMVCDLTTLDSMAQRLGRVNRRGEGDAKIDVVYETDPDPKKKDDGFEKARWRTKVVLERLPLCDESDDRHDASPFALRHLNLSGEERDAAFAPTPTILPATDILFDAWALTAIKGKLPGRPPVEPYLHGISGWEPPETHVAWRKEVGEITGDLLWEYEPGELLDEFPLKPHELLKEPSYRAFKQFEAMAKRLADKAVPVWVYDEDNEEVEVLTLKELADKDRKERIEGKTVILPPSAGGLEGGMLNGTAPAPESGSLDVADTDKRVRVKTRSGELSDADKERVEELHLVYRIDYAPSDGDEDAIGESWLWFTLRNEGDKSAKKPVLWEVHVGDVVTRTKEIVANLPLDEPLKAAIITAAEFHDHGKRRKLFQTVLGNTDPKVLLAKSGKKSGRVKEQYRHEFGSLVDVEKELSGEYRDLILHLIAAHHGRARPHFPQDEAFDPEPKGRAHAEVVEMAAAVPQRFARLQRKYGRWGLAYLESLLRAADWAASGNPSAFVEGG